MINSVQKALEETGQRNDALCSLSLCDTIWETHGAVQIFFGKWMKTFYYFNMSPMIPWRDKSLWHYDSNPF